MEIALKMLIINTFGLQIRKNEKNEVRKNEGRQQAKSERTRQA